MGASHSSAFQDEDNNDSIKLDIGSDDDDKDSIEIFISRSDLDVNSDLLNLESEVEEDPNEDDYCSNCYIRRKSAGQYCDACEAARVACLMCKKRPKSWWYASDSMCSKKCKETAISRAPLLLEVPKGHKTFEKVESEFMNSWKYVQPNTTIPDIQRIFRLIGDKSFSKPYKKYKNAVGKEVTRYHGTKRICTLGQWPENNTKPCHDATCRLCSILRYSFKTSLADASSAFGPGIYSSSASNKAYSYTDSNSRTLLVTKVVLGKVREVKDWNEVMSCPPGFNSVVFKRHNDCLNETVVYSDDAIRPVFLLIF